MVSAITSCIQYCVFGLVLIPLLLLGELHAQQLPQYTQFMYNNLLINPAYAGADKALSMTLIHRDQWTGVEGAPNTQAFSASALLPKDKVGLGVSLLYDKIGVHKNLKVLTSYAYRLQLTKETTLSMGLQVGVTNLRADYASLIGNSNDPKLYNSINNTALDFGAGIYLETPTLKIGIATPELLSKKIQLNDSISLAIRNINLLGFVGYRLALNNQFDFEPSLLLKYYPDLPLSYDINLNMVYRKLLTAGLSYRKNESLAALLKFQLTTQLQVGYAYDFPINEASQLSTASHELMIQYVFRTVKKNVASPR